MDFSFKLSLSCVGNVNYYKSIHHPIPTRGNRGASLQFSEQISKLSFQLSVQVYSLLGQIEEQTKGFFGGCKNWGGHIVRLHSRSIGFLKKWKVSPFVKFEIILTLLFLLELLTYNHCRTWSSMINMWTDFRTSQN